MNQYDDEINQECAYCDGEGWGIIGLNWECEDPINGPYDNEIEPCPYCGGTGLARDQEY